MATGDEQAFQEIFNTYFDLVFTTALRYTVIAQHAEDAAQQVFMKLWEMRSNARSIVHLRSYLCTAAKHEILQQFRKQSVRREYVQQVIEVFTEWQEIKHPDQLLMERQQLSVFQEAVSRLPGRQQEAFRLSREHGMTYAEIATQMNISKETVKEYIAAALKSIREYLKAHPDLLLLCPLWLLS